MPKPHHIFAFCVFLFMVFNKELSAFQFKDVQIHGFVSQGYMISDRNNYLAETESGTFEFQDAAINFSKFFSPEFHVGCQFFARDIGNTGNDKIELDWAFADYRFKDPLGFRFGKIKIPHGLYNETRDIDMLRTFIFLPPVYYDISRSTINAMNGVGIYGHYQLRHMGSIDYQYLYGSKSIDSDSGWARYMERRGMDITNFDVGNIYCANLIWHPEIDGLRLSLSRIFSSIDSTAELNNFPLPPVYNDIGDDLTYCLKDLAIHVASIEYTIDDLILAFEYMTFRGDIEIKTLASDLPLVAFHIPLKTDTYYLSLTYRLSSLLELGGYYAVFWPDSSDKQGKTMTQDFLGWHKEAVMCAKLDITESLTLKAETHLMDGGALIMPQDNPDGVEQRTALFLLKLTLSF